MKKAARYCFSIGCNNTPREWDLTQNGHFIKSVHHSVFPLRFCSCERKAV